MTGANPKTGQDYVLYVEPALTHLSHSPQPWWEQDFPLLSRGWVFQERLLSPRFLHFGPRELSWECSNRVTCECGAIEPTFNLSGYIQGGKIIHSKPRDGTESVRALTARWHMILSEFTKLSLTRSSDQLPAIAGIAQSMRTGREGRYIAGLWEDSMILDLCWDTRSPPSSRPAIWRAPTWSWASLEAGQIGNGVDWSKKHETREDAELLGVTCQPENPDATGLVTSGFLKIRGDMAGFPLCYDLKSNGPGKFYVHITGAKNLSIMQDYDYKSCAKGDVIEEGEMIYFLKLASTFARGHKAEKLQPTYALYVCLRAVALEAGLFERIGMAESAVNKNESFDDLMFQKNAKSEAVTIQ